MALLCGSILASSCWAIAQPVKQWDKTYGTALYEPMSDAIATEDGGYILAGSRGINETGDDIDEVIIVNTDYYVVKIDKEGHKQWEKILGGDDYDYLTEVILVEDGNFLLVGYSNSTASGDKSENPKGGCDEYGGCDTDFWLIKIDKSGNKLWDKTIGGNSREYPSGVVVSQDGGYLLVGSSRSDKSADKSEESKGDLDYWIVKIDSDGNKLWDKTLGGDNSDSNPKIVATSDGGYLLGGTSRSDASGDKSEDEKSEHPYDNGDFWIVKIDSDGNKLWDKTYGGDRGDLLNDLITTTDGGFMLGGRSSSNVSGDKSEENTGITDYWIIKIDYEGNKLWDRTFGGNAEDNLNSMIPTDEGGFLLGGTSYSNASGDKSENRRLYIEYPIYTDYWIIKVNKDGHKEWDKTLGSDSFDFLSNIISTEDGSYLLAGHSLGEASADKTENSQKYDFWVIKIFDTEKDLAINKFYLVNAETDQLLYKLQNKNILNLSESGTTPLSVRVYSHQPKVDSVKLKLTGPVNLSRIERYGPYTLFGDDPKPGGGTDYAGQVWKPGVYRLEATAYLNGNIGTPQTIFIEVIEELAVKSFTFVNEVGEEITAIEEGDIVDLSYMNQTTIKVYTSSKKIKIDSVQMKLSGPISHSHTERYLPYSLFGGNMEPYGEIIYEGIPWPSGQYTMWAKPWYKGKEGTPLTVNFSVISNYEPAPSLRVEVFPVPTQGIIHVVQKGEAEPLDLSLLDHQGQPLMHQSLRQQPVEQLDLSQFKKVFYYLKLVSKEGVIVRKIVIE